MLLAVDGREMHQWQLGICGSIGCEGQGLPGSNLRSERGNASASIETLLATTTFPDCDWQAEERMVSDRRSNSGIFFISGIRFSRYGGWVRIIIGDYIRSGLHRKRLCSPSALRAGRRILMIERSSSIGWFSATNSGFPA